VRSNLAQSSRFSRSRSVHSRPAHSSHRSVIKKRFLPTRHAAAAAPPSRRLPAPSLHCLSPAPPQHLFLPAPPLLLSRGAVPCWRCTRDGCSSRPRTAPPLLPSARRAEVVAPPVRSQGQSCRSSCPRGALPLLPSARGARSKEGRTEDRSELPEADLWPEATEEESPFGVH
jgi:hypothetical protein